MTGEFFSRNDFLWCCAWQSTACVALGLVISFVLRSRPARAHRVLLLAMIAAVIVPTMSLLVKQYELGVFVAQPVVTQPEPEDQLTVTNYEQSETTASENFEHMPYILEEEFSSVLAGTNLKRFTWHRLALWAWATASLILAVRLVVMFVQGIRLLRRAMPLHCKRIEEAVHLAKTKLGISKKVSLYYNNIVRSPVIWCWRKSPVLLLPSVVRHSKDRVDWVSVLCHELAHWKRRDQISGLLAELVVCILPWNLLLWLAKRRLVSLSEQACDDWVVSAGRACTDYADSLLDLTPAGNMAFVPAVVRSSKGLAFRVQRILKSGCSNPRAGAAWAMAVSLAAICLAVGTAFAQTRPSSKADSTVNESQPGQARVVHFPKDRSLGKLEIQDAGAERKLTYWFHWTGIEGPQWEYLGQAQGDVRVPVGKRLSLTVNKTAWRDLSALAKLRPDDLYRLYLPALLLTDRVKPDDKCMPHIAHLTGLRNLALDRTDITEKGLKYITKLYSLEYLGVPYRVTDTGMAHIAALTSLKGIYFPRESRGVTNAGLRHLAKLTFLEEVYLAGERLGDAGLAHLRDLPRLKYLAMYGSGFTDKGMVHVKDMTSLRILSFNESLSRITDAGLAHISDIPNLELLCLHGMKDITDDGLAHLTKMRSLRKLEIGSSQVTDKGLAYLSQIKTLELLDLPQDQHGITDTGLTYLGTLPNLRHLAITRIHFIDPKMNKEYYTDKGLAELAKCRLLEELNIGSPGITDEGMRHVAKLTNLKKLMLFGCENVTNEGLAQLTTLKSLRDLYITDSKITIGGLSYLNEMPELYKLDLFDIEQDHSGLNISGLTNLEELGLSLKIERVDRENNLLITQKITGADLVCLAKLKRLRWLQGINGVTDTGLKKMSGLTNMERLGFGATGLTDDGLKCLANMKNLDLLHINNKYPAKASGAGGRILTDEGLRYLEGLKMLTYLQIDSDNNFSAAAIQRLRRGLPNLYALNINGSNSQPTGMGARASAARQPQRPTLGGRRPARSRTDRQNRTRPTRIR